MMPIKTRVLICFALLTPVAATGQPTVLFDIPSATHSASRLTFNSDGSLLAEAMYGSVRVWSVEQQKLVRQFFTEGQAQAPAFSPDSSTIVIADGVGNLGYLSTIYSVNLQTGRESKLGECHGAVHDLRFSPKGDRIAAVTSYGSIMGMMNVGEDKTWYGGEIVVWDTQNKDIQWKLRSKLPAMQKLDALEAETLVESFTQAVMNTVPIHLRFSSDGTRIATNTHAGLIKILDANTGAEQLKLEGLGIVDFSADNSKIECAGRVYDSNGELTESRSAQRWIAKAGSIAAEFRSNGKLQLMNVATRATVTELPQSDPKATLLAVSPNGKCFATIETGKVRVWQTVAVEDALTTSSPSATASP